MYLSKKTLTHGEDYRPPKKGVSEAVYFTNRWDTMNKGAKRRCGLCSENECVEWRGGWGIHLKCQSGVHQVRPQTPEQWAVDHH